MTEVTLPDRVVSIRENAFGNCKELTNVMIPESVETIDFFAFQATGLTCVAISEGVTNYKYDGI